MISPNHSDFAQPPARTIWEQDAEFWAAHAAWRAKEALAIEDDDCHESFVAMMRVPVRTACAIAAKLAACNWSAVELPGSTAGNALTMIEWDLGRLVQGELTGTAVGLASKPIDLTLRRTGPSMDTEHLGE